MFDLKQEKLVLVQDMLLGAMCMYAERGIKSHSLCTLWYLACCSALNFELQDFEDDENKPSVKALVIEEHDEWTELLQDILDMDDKEALENVKNNAALFSAMVQDFGFVNSIFSFIELDLGLKEWSKFKKDCAQFIPAHAMSMHNLCKRCPLHSIGRFQNRANLCCNWRGGGQESYMEDFNPSMGSWDQSECQEPECGSCQRSCLQRPPGLKRYRCDEMDDEARQMHMVEQIHRLYPQTEQAQRYFGPTEVRSRQFKTHCKHPLGKVSTTTRWHRVSAPNASQSACSRFNDVECGEEHEGMQCQEAGKLKPFQKLGQNRESSPSKVTISQPTCPHSHVPGSTCPGAKSSKPGVSIDRPGGK